MNDPMEGAFALVQDQHGPYFPNQPRDHTRISVNKHLNQDKICCLSCKADNFALWAHYAHEHTGVCLGFSIDATVLQKSEPNIEGPIKIKYDNVIPQFQTDKPIDSIDILSHKPEDWGYEEEYRLIVRSSAEGMRKIGEVEEIILGMECSLARLVNFPWADKKGLFRRAVIIPGKFGLHIKSIDDVYLRAKDKWDYRVTKNSIMIREYYGDKSDVKIPSTMDGLPVVEIGAGAFCDNNLTSVCIPASVTKIGKHVFSDNLNLTAIDVDKNNTAYTSKEGVLFDKNMKVLIFYPEGKNRDVIIPEGITTIGDYAFGHNALKSVVVPNGVISIGQRAFWRKNLSSVVIPDGVTSIGSEAFSSNKLKDIIIPDSVTYIDKSAFAGNQLTNIVIPGSVTSIEWGAFNCNRLASINISDGVKSIGENAFSYNELTKIDIPSSVTSIGGGAFSNNPRLVAINVDPCNAAYTSIDGILFDKSGKTLICYPCGKSNKVIISDGVTSIGNGAFFCNKLTSIVIPDSVRSIDDKAFAFTEQLTSIVIDVDVTLHEGAFGHNVNKNVVFTVFYNKNGKKAGQYTYNKTSANWSYVGEIKVEGDPSQ